MNYRSVFDIIDLEDGNASVLLAQARILKDSGRARYSRLNFCREKYSEYNAEYKGICQSCGEKRDFLRIPLDCDVFICYDCYHEGMKQNGEFYSYHGCRAEDLDGFIYEDEWEDLWEEENGYIKDEETDVIKTLVEEVPSIVELFKVFEKQLGV